ncbi:MAG: hypothetical protein MRT15_03750 [archaeon YNP-LCB-003-016]|nr:hypothetical protein [Candidatus Culexarchaeum yellowstonense]
MIITTEKYTRDEIREILKIRAEEEEISINEKALELLTEIGEKTSLRYAVQMLTPAYIHAKKNGRKEVTPEDVEEVKRLFADVKESARYLKEHEEEMLK